MDDHEDDGNVAIDGGGKDAEGVRFSEHLISVRPVHRNRVWHSESERVEGRSDVNPSELAGAPHGMHDLAVKGRGKQ